MVKNWEFDNKKMKMAQIISQWHKLYVNGTNYVSIAQIISHPVLFYESVPSHPGLTPALLELS